jgi:hypothetical protein
MKKKILFLGSDKAIIHALQCSISAEIREAHWDEALKQNNDNDYSVVIVLDENPDCRNTAHMVYGAALKKYKRSLVLLLTNDEAFESAGLEHIKLNNDRQFETEVIQHLVETS